MVRRMISMGLVAIATLSGCSAEIGDAEEAVESSTQAVVEHMTWSGHMNVDTDDSAAVSSGPDRLDLFTIESGRLWYRPYAHSTGWRTPVDLKKPAVFNEVRTVAAVKNGAGTRIDVFAVAASQKIYHRYKTGSGDTDWSAWFQILNQPTVKADSALAVTSWASGRLDLFWWTPSDNLGHAWATNNQWSGTESGDTPSKTYLQVPGHDWGGDLTAVSWGPNRIDLFYVTGPQKIAHHWFSNGWAEPELFNVWSVEDGQFPWPTSVAVASKGANQLELFTLAYTDGARVLRSTFAGSWPLVPGVANTLKFDLVGHHQTQAPATIDTAIRWMNGTRIDLFGSDLDRLWQAFK